MNLAGTMQAPTKHQNQEVQGTMNTNLLEMFHALRDTQVDLADSIIQIARLVIGCLLLLIGTLGLMLFQWLNHSMLPYLCAGLLTLAIAGICWAWFALPSEIDELFEPTAPAEFGEK
jgi:protein-S-isoprenylcysteine O-methyltransferase Ste14